MKFEHKNIKTYAANANVIDSGNQEIFLSYRKSRSPDRTVWMIRLFYPKLQN